MEAMSPILAHDVDEEATMIKLRAYLLTLAETLYQISEVLLFRRLSILSFSLFVPVQPNIITYLIPVTALPEWRLETRRPM